MLSVKGDLELMTLPELLQWAEINGKDVFIASKIKKDPDIEIIKVRLTKDGTPFWTMTSEQLAMEMEKD